MDFIEILKAVLFGIVEGITEWLPISSTGHMILLDEFIHLQVSEEFMSMFEVVIQLGAIFAVESKPVWTAWKFFLKISDFSGNFENVLNVCLKSVPYFSIIGLVLSGLSILFLLLSKQKKSVGKIVFLSITMAGLAVILILYFVLGGSL